jgi:hypothetical protein
MEFTFLYATRNDNYCGDSPLRMKTSLSALLQQLETKFIHLQSKTEVIVVDWNSDEPLQDHPYFRGIRVPGLLKYVLVPPHLAAKYNSKGPLSEVHAYNVGARLAKGKYILRLDQDILVGSRFLQYLETLLSLQVDMNQLEPMWCSRRELPPHLVDDIVQNPVDFVNCVAHRLPLWCNEKYINGVGAVGIFGMPRQLWHRIHGYHESLTGWGHMEVEISQRFEQLSISWINLHDTVGCEFVHIWHPVHGSERTINDHESFPPRNQADTWGCLVDIPSFAVTI